MSMALLDLRFFVLTTLFLSGVEPAMLGTHEAGDKCTDTMTQCTHWQQNGFCTGHYTNYMAIICRKSCNIDNCAFNVPSPVIDPCSSRPCQNGGVCSSRPCQNGGVCETSNRDFSCSCRPDFTGNTCDTVAAITLTSRPSKGWHLVKCYTGAHIKIVDINFRGVKFTLAMVSKICDGDSTCKVEGLSFRRNARTGAKAFQSSITYSCETNVTTTTTSAATKDVTTTTTSAATKDVTTTTASAATKDARTGECPTDKRKAYCYVSPCLVSHCPSHPAATCRDDYCGGCNARWFVNGQEVTYTCDVEPECAPYCDVPPCRLATCQAYPEATCQADNCNCRPRWYIDYFEVTDMCQH